MAIANSDGSIILSTKVDTSGMEQGTKSLKSQAAKLAAEYRKAGMSQSEAFKKAWSEIERTQKETDSATKSIENFGKQSQKSGKQAKGTFDGLKATLQSVAGYLAIAFSVTKIIQFSNEAGQLATQTEASVQRLVDIYGSASDSVGDFIDANARALGMSKAAAASFSSVYGNLFSVWADQATNAELTNRYLNMTAVVASKTGRTVQDVQERVRSGLIGNTEAIEDLGIFVNVKTIEMTDAFQRMADGKSWEQLDAYTQQQIRSMAILEQATAKYGDEVADTSATIRNRFNAAYQDFQNSWENIINTVLLPVLEVLTQIFDIATRGLNALSGISGSLLGNIESQEETTDKTADNIKEQVKNQKELTKEVKKTLAGFDEIQILSANTAGGTSDELDSSIQGIGTGGNSQGNNIEQEINDKLVAIMAVASVSLLALGCILLFTGNIAWGLGLIIAGAVALGITAGVYKDDSISEKTKETLEKAIVIAGISAVVIGILLCLVHRWAWGLGMIVAGAATLGFFAAVNWNSIKEKLKEEEAQKWIVIGGTVTVVLGILLCFASRWGLGIGLIAAGATTLGFEIALNWDSLKLKIEETARKHKALFILGSFLLVVLGVALLFTGVGIPFGLAWIAAGAQGISTGITEDWDFMPNKIKEVWGKVKQFWKTNIAPIFTVGWWRQLAIDAGNGLIGGFESAINGVITLFEKMANKIVDAFNALSFDLPDILGGGHVGFDLSKVYLGRLSIPRLAKGAVIPPNREFLAVLGDQKHGTNIEAPLQTIVDAFNIALSQNGGYNGGGNTEVVLEIDGREFGRAVVEQGNRENRRIGTRLVIA